MLRHLVYHSEDVEYKIPLCELEGAWKVVSAHTHHTTHIQHTRTHSHTTRTIEKRDVLTVAHKEVEGLRRIEVEEEAVFARAVRSLEDVLEARLGRRLLQALVKSIALPLARTLVTQNATNLIQ